MHQQQLPDPRYPSFARAPPTFHLPAKPTGAACNLACSYCFFNEPMMILAMLLNRGRPASDVMPILVGRKEALSRTHQETRPEQLCPCSGGLTYQMCHGQKRPGRDRRGLNKAVGHPGPPVCTTIRENS